MTSLRIFAVAAVAVALPAAAFAWGSTGHRIIGEAAMAALPAELPGFLHRADSIRDVGEYSREPDRVKGAGKAFDSDFSPAHFVDAGDDGKILGGPSLAALPPTREDYDGALRAVGQDSWKAGYLPYSMLDSYERLAKEFAYWRAADYAARNPRYKAHKAWFEADRRRRETQVLIAIGQLSHFVGDGSQPLHVTVHFNGWGDYPNPGGFTGSRQFHGAFEGDLVQAQITEPEVAARMAPFKNCGCAMEQRMSAYLSASARLVTPLYELERAGGMAAGDRRGADFARQQLAVGASEVRDLVVEAWRASTRVSVGWKPVPLTDILSGKVDPYVPLYASVD